MTCIQRHRSQASSHVFSLQPASRFLLNSVAMFWIRTHMVTMLVFSMVAPLLVAIPPISHWQSTSINFPFTEHDPPLIGR